MLITCKNNDNYDRFYIPELNTLDDLKQYAEKNMPISCYLLDGRYDGYIYIREDMTKVNMYLNKYNYYYNIKGVIIEQKEYDELYSIFCKNCIKNRESWGCISDCQYKDGSFTKYEQKKPIINKKWWETIKNKLK